MPPVSRKMKQILVKVTKAIESKRDSIDYPVSECRLHAFDKIIYGTDSSEY